MSMKSVGVLSFLLLGIPVEAYAQACDGILRHGLRNVSVQMGAQAASAFTKRRNCGKVFKDQSEEDLAALEVEAFGYGKGNGSYSRERRETDLREWCDESVDQSASSEDTYSESQTIYAPAVEAWSRCNELQSERTIIDPNVDASGQNVAMAIRYTGPGSGGVRFYGLSTVNFTCDVRAPNPGGTGFLTNEQILARQDGIVIGPESISVQCTRQPAIDKDINGQKFSIMENAVISVRTASSPFQLSFPAQSDKSLPLADVDRLDSINREFAAEIEKAKALLGQIQTANANEVAALNTRLQAAEQSAAASNAKLGRVQSGVMDVGPGGPVAKLRVNFPRPFGSKPRVYATTDTHINDFISVVVHDVDGNGFTAGLWRLGAGPWGAVQRINWIAVEGDL